MEDLLETERLRLRRFTETDLDNLVGLDSDPEVMRYLNGGIPTPREAIENEILPRFLRSSEPGFGYWAADAKDSGEFLGWFSLNASEGAWVKAALGYRLRRAAWGRGYATEGARKLLRSAFTQPGIERVVATTYEENLASRRVMEKLGMRLVRRFRPTLEDLTATGTYQVASPVLFEGDDVEYALTRAEWQRRQEPPTPS